MFKKIIMIMMVLLLLIGCSAPVEEVEEEEEVIVEPEVEVIRNQFDGSPLEEGEVQKYKAVAEKVSYTAATARQAEIEIGEKSSDEVRKELADRWSVVDDDGRLQDHEGSRSN